MKPTARKNGWSFFAQSRSAATAMSASAPSWKVLSGTSAPSKAGPSWRTLLAALLFFAPSAAALRRFARTMALFSGSP